MPGSRHWKRLNMSALGQTGAKFGERIERELASHSAAIEDVSQAERATPGALCTAMAEVCEVGTSDLSKLNSVCAFAISMRLLGDVPFMASESSR